MSEMENVAVLGGRCVGPGMSERHIRISNTNVYRVLKFRVCCYLFLFLFLFQYVLVCLISFFVTFAHICDACQTAITDMVTA